LVCLILQILCRSRGCSIDQILNQGERLQDQGDLANGDRPSSYGGNDGRANGDDRHCNRGSGTKGDENESTHNGGDQASQSRYTS
jgi:hypothetical protein